MTRLAQAFVDFRLTVAPWESRGRRQHADSGIPNKKEQPPPPTHTRTKTHENKKGLTNKSRRAEAAVAAERVFANAQRSAGVSLAVVDVYLAELAR